MAKPCSGSWELNEDWRIGWFEIFQIAYDMHENIFGIKRQFLSERGETFGVNNQLLQDGQAFFSKGVSARQNEVICIQINCCFIVMPITKQNKKEKEMSKLYTYALQIQ